VRVEQRKVCRPTQRGKEGPKHLVGRGDFDRKEDPDRWCEQLEMRVVAEIRFSRLCEVPPHNPVVACSSHRLTPTSSFGLGSHQHRRCLLVRSVEAASNHVVQKSTLPGRLRAPFEVNIALRVGAIRRRVLSGENCGERINVESWEEFVHSIYSQVLLRDELESFQFQVEISRQIE
jgi:hypothetical protein